MGLGKLEKIENLRSVWPDEARNFTPWLASAENISQLADAIGFGSDGIEFERLEENVGAFFADIIARDTSSTNGGRVLIENQFGRTNHDHLGKILTYASGLKDIRTIVWIAETFRDEHRAALDWLNRHTETGIAFFGVEIELWKIGLSEPAPRFNVISRPNDWEKRTTSLAVDSEMSDLRKLYVRYWTALGERIKAKGGELRPQKALPQQWTNMRIGRANFTLVATATDQTGVIRAELAMTGDTGKLAIAELMLDQSNIDREYGAGLIWDEMAGRKQSRVSEALAGNDIWNEDEWPSQHKWLIGRLEKLHAVFSKRVATLNLNSTAPHT